MSTDSTELTFVRCPSCRSLVPAVSTRCRMCGSAIDSQGKDASEPEAPRRARSNTTVQPQTEFVDATEAVRASSTQAAPAPAPGDDSDFEDFDPLKEYLDDEGREEPKASKPTSNEPSRQTVQSAPEEEQEEKPESTFDEMVDDEEDFDIFGSDDDDADDDDWLDDIDEPVVARTEEKQEARKPEPAPQPVRKEEPAPRQERNAQQPVNGGQQPRVVVESGARPAGKPSNLSFGKGRAEPNGKQQQAEARGDERANGNRNDRNEKQARPQQPQKPAGPHFGEKREQKGQQESRDNRREQQAQPKAPAQAKQHEKGGRQPDQRGNDQRQGGADIQRVRQEAGRAPEAVDSRLVGWLVSFSTPTRSSIELREGKFFVSAGSIKPNDLILEDQSISTPHAMVAVESGRLQVQDLMSESGVYRRREGENDFVQFGEPFDLKHGDWVRFGKVDFLVTMIPAEQRR